MKKYLPIVLTVAIAFPSFVMAQALLDVATSTATSTDAVVEEMATSTLALDLQVATSTATTSASSDIESAKTARAILDDIASDQDKYFAEHGEYLPILPNNKLLPNKPGTVTEKLGHDIPPGASVEVYDGPHGKGYRVVYMLGTKRYSVGYGPDAIAFTYTTDLSAPKSNVIYSTMASTSTSASQVDNIGSSTAKEDSTSPEASTTPITLPDATTEATTSTE